MIVFDLLITIFIYFFYPELFYFVLYGLFRIPKTIGLYGFQCLVYFCSKYSEKLIQVYIFFSKQFQSLRFLLLNLSLRKLFETFRTFLITKFLQKLGIGILDNNTIYYYSCGKFYKVRIPKNRFPNRILGFETYTDFVWEDISENVMECLGKSKNFHGIPTTPKLLGYSNIKVLYTNGNEKIFDENEIIEIF